MRLSKRTRSRGGFTLIELMIVVALIGMMAAIAIPQFFVYQARARRGEGFGNLSGLARAYLAYGSERDTYPDMLTVSGEPTLPAPGDHGKAAPDTVKMPWDSKAVAFFDDIGWQSEGSVYYTYDVNTDTGCTCALCFTATAHGDVDGDGAMSALMYVRPQRASDGTIVDVCPDSLFGYGPPVRALPSGGLTTVYEEVAVQASTDRY